MKRIILIALMAAFCGLSNHVLAQETDSSKTYLVIKNDGTEYVGTIVSKDAREILLRTEEVGDIYIPMHEVKSIKEVKSSDIAPNGDIIKSESYPTVYSFTSNAFPIKKGNSYAQWNYLLPEFNFGVNDNISLSFMTSIIGIPIIGKFKYSIPLTEKENVYASVGAWAGTLSWAAPDIYMVYPNAALTFGNPNANINIGGGFAAFGADGESHSRGIVNFGGMAKVSNRLSIIVETTLAPPSEADEQLAGFIIPSLRFDLKKNRALQFGFPAFFYDGSTTPIPVPAFQYYHRI
ncbi:MAG: hypothetical protein JXR19_00725 [Bacteroidia bacterium]